MSTRLAYPLRWPLGHPRTASKDRKPSLFRETSTSGYKRPPTFDEGRRRVLAALDAYTRAGQDWRVPMDSIQITTDTVLTQRGTPAAGRREPDDVGVCVYFTLDGVPYALPCDKWATLGENLAAVAAHVEALRGIERWGVGTAKEHFAGFRALPAQGQTGEGRAAWWAVLGLATPGDLRDDAHLAALYRKRAAETHPDAPNGSHEAFVVAGQARDEAAAYLRGKA